MHYEFNLVNTDRGGEYTASLFRAACERLGVCQSMGRPGSALDKAWASYCTSWCCCGGNSAGELAALAFDQPGVGGVGRVEQGDVLVVGLAGGEQPGAPPGLDGGDVHAEARGGLGHGEQAAGAQPVGVAGQVVALAQVEHDPAGEGFAFAGAVPGGVERGGGLGGGVVIQEPVEQGEGLRFGLAELPGGRRDGDVEAGDLAAAESDVQVDAVGLGHGDVVDEQPGHALALALRGGRVGPQGGEVGGQRADAGLVGLGERGGGRGGVVVVVLGGLQGAQRLVPVGFQGSGDQPVAGVDGEVAAAGQVGAVPGAFDVAGSHGAGFGGAGPDLGLDGEGDLEGQRGEGLEQQLAGGGAGGAAGDGLAARPGVVDALAHALVVRDLGAAAGVAGDGHPPPAPAADRQ